MDGIRPRRLGSRAFLQLPSANTGARGESSLSLAIFRALHQLTGRNFSPRLLNREPYLLVNAVCAAAQRVNCYHGDQSNQNHYQRIFDQVLATVIPPEPAEESSNRGCTKNSSATALCLLLHRHLLSTGISNLPSPFAQSIHQAPALNQPLDYFPWEISP